MKKQLSAWFYAIPAAFIVLAILIGSIGFASLSEDCELSGDELESAQKFTLKDGKASANFKEAGVYTLYRIYNIPYDEGAYWSPLNDNNYVLEHKETRQRAELVWSWRYEDSRNYDGKTAKNITSFLIEEPGEYTLTATDEDKKSVDGTYMIISNDDSDFDLDDLIGFIFFMFILILIGAAVISTIIIASERSKRKMQQSYSQPYSYHQQYQAYQQPAQQIQYPQYQPQNPVPPQVPYQPYQPPTEQ